MLIKDLYKLIKDCIWAGRYKRAVRKAKKLSALFNMTYFVILYRGKLEVIPKKNIKRLISQRKFKRGTTVQDIEKIALYVAK